MNQLGTIISRGGGLLRRSTFNLVRDILRDYPKLDAYIAKRKEEIEFPYKPSDVNADIRGNQQTDNMTNRLIKIEQDKRLIGLERQKLVIELNINQADERTSTIIEELYFKARPKYTPKGLADEVLHIDESYLHKLRNDFFIQLATDLGLPIE